jgi:hypothetical protein
MSNFSAISVPSVVNVFGCGFAALCNLRIKKFWIFIPMLQALCAMRTFV